MTGRDVIMYILQNQLEDEDLIKDGFLDPHMIGFMSELEAAAKFHVGVSTIRVWMQLGFLTNGVRIGNSLYFPINTEHPVKGTSE